ncbi:hypothetical protein Cus16_1212 [Curtobacterium sp. ER1/6]|nr:hypothetical protein Cus16_1212 [Curtobacterium sp. ER1/6]
MPRTRGRGDGRISPGVVGGEGREPLGHCSALLDAALVRPERPTGVTPAGLDRSLRRCRDRRRPIGRAGPCPPGFDVGADGRDRVVPAALGQGGQQWLRRRERRGRVAANRWVVRFAQRLEPRDRRPRWCPVDPEPLETGLRDQFLGVGRRVDRRLRVAVERHRPRVEVPFDGGADGVVGGLRQAVQDRSPETGDDEDEGAGLRGTLGDAHGSP